MTIHVNFDYYALLIILHIKTQTSIKTIWRISRDDSEESYQTREVASNGKRDINLWSQAVTIYLNDDVVSLSITSYFSCLIDPFSLI